MPYSRFVEPGRIVLVNFGDDIGKLGVILGIATQTKVLVGSVTGDDAFISGRRIISLNQLDLTDIKVDLSIGASQGDINSAAASAAADFAATGWAKKKAKKALRASLSDFQRFKVMTLRKKRSRALKAALGK